MSQQPVTFFTLTRPVGVAAVLVSALCVQGCATRQEPDPFEPWNRKVFKFNERLDDKVLKPVAIGYKAVTPQPFRTAVSNFGNNIRDVWSAINLFLQGRPGAGAQQVMRVSVNTTLGLAGFIDIATPMQLERQNEDFGQTLGVWGVKPGAYIVWPVLGPSTARDSVGIPGDLYFSPRRLADNATEANLWSALQIVNARAAYLDATGLLQDIALDKYAFVRDAYLQRRQNLIYNGDPPEEDDDDGYEDDDGADGGDANPTPPPRPDEMGGAAGQDQPASVPPAAPGATSLPTEPGATSP